MNRTNNTLAAGALIFASMLVFNVEAMKHDESNKSDESSPAKKSQKQEQIIPMAQAPVIVPITPTPSVDEQLADEQRRQPIVPTNEQSLPLFDLLPDEVVNLIFNFVIGNTTQLSQYKDLASLEITCKRLCAIGRNLFFQDIFFPPARLSCPRKPSDGFPPPLRIEEKAAIIRFIINHPAISLNLMDMETQSEDLKKLLANNRIKGILENLNLSYSINLLWDNDTMDLLAHITNLRNLNLSYLSFLTATELNGLLERLAPNNTLQGLTLLRDDRIEWNDVHVAHFSRFTNFRSLNLSGANITEQLNKLLAQFTQGPSKNTLQDLNLAWCSLIHWNKVDVALFSQFTALRSLNLLATRITEEQLNKLLAQFTQGPSKNTLQNLNLSWCHGINWNKVDFAPFSQFTALHRLDLSETSITAEQLKSLLTQGTLKDTLRKIILPQTLSAHQATLEETYPGISFVFS